MRFWVALIFVVGVFPAFGTGDGLAKIEKRKVLVVAMHQEDFPPFTFKDGSGNLQGVDLELVHQIASELGVSVHILRTASSFTELLDQVAKGQADIGASALYLSLQRAKKVLYTHSYSETRPILLVNRVVLAKLKKSGEPVSSFNQKGISIGIYERVNPVSSVAAERFPAATLVKYKDRESLMSDIKAAKLGAVYVDEIEVRKWRQKWKDLDLWVAAMEDSERSLGVSFAVAPDNIFLANWLNLFIESRKKSGALDRLFHETLRFVK